MLVLTVAPCACGELLGADTPEALSEAGAIVDASRDAPVDAAADRKTNADAAFDASGVALLVNPSQIVFTPPLGSAGATPPPQTAIVVNAGTAPSPPISASVQIDTTDFYVMQSSCSKPLEADASCSVTVGARASATGEAAMLKVGGDGVYAYASILGPGTGLAFEAPPCQFSPVDPGSASLCTLVLDNNGPTTLPAPMFSIVQQPPGTAFSFDNGPPSCPSPFAPGSSCAVTLTFAPPATMSFPYLATLSATAGADTASAGLEGFTPDEGDSGGTDTGSAAGPPPLLSGPDWSVLGVTSTGTAIVSGLPGIFAVQLPDGPSAPFTAIQPSATDVVGNTVFVWSNGGSDLLLWSSGPALPAATASLPIFAAVYGQVAYFLDDWDSTTETADLVSLTLDGPDGSGAGQVIATVTLSSASPTAFDPCTPRWQATTAALYLGACVGGSGQFAESVWTLDPTGTATPVATGVAPMWGADAAGDRVFVATSSGQGQVLGPTGNLVATLDTGVTEGVMLADGQHAVYVAGGSLWQGSISASVPVQLADNAAGLWGLSPTEAVAVYYDTARTGTSVLGPTGDIWLTPLVVPAPFQLATSQAVPWAFTTDETHLSWLPAPPTAPATVYPTVISPTAGPSTSSLKIMSVPAGLPLPVGGSTLVYQLMAPPYPELRAIDTSTSTDSVVVSQTDPGFALSGPLLVYAVPAGAGAGVYVVPRP